jgi:hypothetical protein
VRPRRARHHSSMFSEERILRKTRSRFVCARLATKRRTADRRARRAAVVGAICFGAYRARCTLVRRRDRVDDRGVLQERISRGVDRDCIGNRGRALDSLPPLPHRAHAITAAMPSPRRRGNLSRVPTHGDPSVKRQVVVLISLAAAVVVILAVCGLVLIRAANSETQYLFGPHLSRDERRVITTADCATLQRLQAAYELQSDSGGRAEHEGNDLAKARAKALRCSWFSE